MDFYKPPSEYPAMQKETEATLLPDFLLPPFYFGAVIGQSSKLSSDLLHQLFLKNSFPPGFPPPNPRLFLFQRMSFAAQLHKSLCLVTKGQHSAARGPNQDFSTHKGFTSNWLCSEWGTGLKQRSFPPGLSSAQRGAASALKQ